MATVRELISGSLRLIGAIASGEALEASEEADALSSLNGMIETWNNERLMVYDVSPEAFNLTPSQASYTIGTGGDFNTKRPLRIEMANLRKSGQDIDYPLSILNDKEYADIKQKSLQSGISDSLYMDNSYPLARIYLYPICNVAASVTLWTWNQISSFASVNDSVSLPPAYYEALRYNLAVRIAPEYSRSPSPIVIAEAEKTIRIIKSMNAPTNYMECDIAITGNSKSYNIYTGGANR